jgi:hypothetical protein
MVRYCPTCNITLTAGDRTARVCGNGHQLPAEVWSLPLAAHTTFGPTLRLTTGDCHVLLTALRAAEATYRDAGLRCAYAPRLQEQFTRQEEQAAKLRDRIEEATGL